MSLTKGELLSLYENAIAKGDTLKLDAGDNTFVNAAVHELDEHEDHLPLKEPKKDGYYYYYYPIKSFIDEMTSQTSGSVSKILLFVIKTRKMRHLRKCVGALHKILLSIHYISL